LAFARAGATVVFCYRSDHAAAQAVCDEATPLSGSVQATQCDVTDSSAVQQMVGAVLRSRGRLDVLVNNVGSFPEKAFVEISDAEWSEALAVNLSSVFFCCRAVLPAMMAAGGGVIVNIASVAGQRGSARHAHYAAAKGGVLALTRSLAREFAAYNIRVNAIAPGRIATDLLLEHATPEEQTRWQSDTPARRLGSPAEVAAAVLFLADPANGYMMGETLSINGGMYMR
jgi:NAD(P)-dependent dehydrogenase (short-subunit alcohol dehydrogenase family)